MTIVAALAAAIQRTAATRAARAALAQKITGIRPHWLVSRAARGQDINALAFLQLCALVGIDPTSGASVPTDAARVPAAINWDMFGYGMRGHRILAGNLSTRAFADKVGITAATVVRAEQMRPLSGANYLALCRAAGVDPHHWARFTGNNCCNSLTNQQEVAHGCV